jgi:hypothetical protein
MATAFAAGGVLGAAPALLQALAFAITAPLPVVAALLPSAPAVAAIGAALSVVLALLPGHPAALDEHVVILGQTEVGAGQGEHRGARPGQRLDRAAPVASRSEEAGQIIEPASIHVFVLITAG